MDNTNLEAMIGQLNPQVAGELNQFVVGPAAFDRSKVVFKAGNGVVVDYAAALADNLASISTIGGHDKITGPKVTRYLNTLLFLRICMVTRDNARQPYMDSVPFPVVPAFFSVFLENIGIVKDELLGIELVPEFQSSPTSEEESEDLTTKMTVAEFTAFSQLLTRFSRGGFEYADRLPRDTRGSWDMMSMQFLGDHIMHHDGKSSAFAAMFASMYNQVWLSTLIVPRVSYGPTIRFRGLVRKLAELKG